ncbi:g6515 [Coccomyxa viridis]|uniref:G6515 protein n=1 Tax=Coccomyxa viridis TaxID=1274662 RepID=A0ABP1G236_9CHLO
MWPQRGALLPCLVLAVLPFANGYAALKQPTYEKPVTDEELTSPITKYIDKSFHRYAEEVQSSKTGRGSSYSYIYSKYLSMVRREPMRLLEIGMGCSVHGGVNGLNTLALWRKYLTNTKISFVENDADCAKKHKAEIEAVAKGKVYVGDQEDVSVLNEIVEDAAQFSGYDIIVDDGGHKSSQMLTSFRVLWQALKSGGIYVVEDLSENYIEKPFLDKGTFTEFMKTALDIVQCRMKPEYMGPESPVKMEFKEFCASNAMDIISIECMPEACVLVKGKPRVRMVPEKAVDADKAEQGAVAKEEALGSGTADPAADMFNAKAVKEEKAIKKADADDTVVLKAPKKPGAKTSATLSKETLLRPDDADDEDPGLDEEFNGMEQEDTAPMPKPKKAPVEKAAAKVKAAKKAAKKAPEAVTEPVSKAPKKAAKEAPAKADSGAAAKVAAVKSAAFDSDGDEDDEEDDGFELSDGPSDEGTAINPMTEQDDIEEPAAEEEAFTDAFEEEDEEDFRHRKLLKL